MGHVYLAGRVVGTFEPQTKGSTGKAYIKDIEVGEYTLEESGIVVVEGGSDVGSYVTEQTKFNEVRFMRNGGEVRKVNDLETHVLGTTETQAHEEGQFYIEGTDPVKFGIRVWKRDKNGNETEITNGTPVAVVYKEIPFEGKQFATWDCPEVPLEPTDTIVVRCYAKIGADPYILLPCVVKVGFYTEWQSEQLSAKKLNSAKWVVTYQTLVVQDGVYTYSYLIFGDQIGGYESFIENFSWER